MYEPIGQHFRQRSGQGIRKSWLASDRPSRESFGLGQAGHTGQPFYSAPQHKELFVGTLRALIRGAGMTVDEFLSLL